MKALSVGDWLPLFGASIALIAIAALLALISLDIRAETRALQQIAASTSQIVCDNAAEQARLDRQDDRIEETLEHLADVAKRGKK